MPKQSKVVFINGLLLTGLVGLLLAYIIVVNNLPAQIYTRAQQEYLSYNATRKISQVAPLLNIIQADNQIVAVNLPGQKSIVQANLNARYEEQENVSITIYDLDFQGEYQLTHSGPMSSTVELFFPFPANLETLHNVRFLVDGQEPPEARYSTQGISWQTVLETSQEHQIVISYKADGVNSFAYGLHQNQRSDVDVTITVTGLLGSKVSSSSLPTTASKLIENSEIFTWSYTGLIADRNIQLTLPTRLSFAQRIAHLQDDFYTLSILAPFLVAAFLISLAVILHLSGLSLPLENYLLIGLGLALFYPTFTFLSGVINVIPAAGLTLLLISGLLSVFLGLVVGWRKVWWRIGLLLVVFLGIFSLGMLTPWRGLLLSVGSLLLVAVFMLLYARRPLISEPDTLVDADSKSEAPLPQNEAPPPSESVLPPPEATPVSTHCPHCARLLADDFSFCPGCGHDTSYLHHCLGCGHQQLVPSELEQVYCLSCGQLFSKD